MTTQKEIDYKILRMQILSVTIITVVLIIVSSSIIIMAKPFTVRFETDDNTLEAVKEMNMTSLYKSQENQRFRIAERGEFDYLNHTFNNTRYPENGYYIVFNIPPHWVKNSTLTIKDCENLSMQIVREASFVNKMCEGLK